MDDVVRCNGLESGLGPYGTRLGVPPFLHGAPIDNHYVPLPAHDVTELIPLGSSEVLFDLIDTQGEVYGNTAVYLVRDCGTALSNEDDLTTLDWVSHVVQTQGVQSDLEVVSGLLSDLASDGDFSRSCSLGSYVDTTQVVDERLDPPVGNAYYYLISGTCARPIGYGNSTLLPDPRAALEGAGPGACL